MSHEAWYDAEIAPELAAIAKKCEERCVPFLAVVEYAPASGSGPARTWHRGRTGFLPKDAGLEMVMLHHCVKMGVNVDGYIIGLRRYCKEEGIDTSASLFLGEHLFGSTPVYRKRVDLDVAVSEMPWIHGLPPVDQVEAHEKEHPAATRRGPGGHPGGTWLCFHMGGRIGDYAGMTVLHVAQPGERISARADRRHEIEQTATEPTVVLANGVSFWQALEDCHWTATSRFLPCTSEGLPVCLVEPTDGNGAR